MTKSQTFALALSLTRMGLRLGLCDHAPFGLEIRNNTRAILCKEIGQAEEKISLG